MYLIFNQGWEDARTGLAAQGIGLGRALAGLMSGESEALGLWPPYNSRHLRFGGPTRVPRA